MCDSTAVINLPHQCLSLAQSHPDPTPTSGLRRVVALNLYPFVSLIRGDREDGARVTVQDFISTRYLEQMLNCVMQIPSVRGLTLDFEACVSTLQPSVLRNLLVWGANTLASPSSLSSDFCAIDSLQLFGGERCGLFTDQLVALCEGSDDYCVYGNSPCVSPAATAPNVAGSAASCCSFVRILASIMSLSQARVVASVTVVVALTLLCCMWPW